MPVVIANLYVNETRYIEVQSIDSKSHERESKVILIIHQLQDRFHITLWENLSDSSY